MIDPLPAMFAAVDAVERGDIGELELEWTTEDFLGNNTRLTITVRREVKHFTMQADTEPS